MLDFFLGVTAEHDVGTATGHVGGDGHGARPAGLGDHLRLALVLFGVEHLVLDLFLGEPLGQILGGLDGGGTHQHRRATLHAVAHRLDDGVEFLLQGQVDQIVGVLTDHRPVGGNHHHVHTVNLAEFHRLGVGGTGHAGQLLVEPEIVLEGGGGQRLVFLLDAHPFLGFHRLVNALGPAAAGHGAAGVLVDDHDLAVLHHVFAVLVEQRVGLERRVHVVQQGQVMGGVEAFALLQDVVFHQQRLDQLVAFLGELHLALFLIDEIVAFVFLGLRLEPGNQHVHLLVQLGGVRRRAGNDQRRARLVDQDRVHLIDNGVIERPLHPVFQTERHVVAQIVEAEFVVGAVGHVAGVGFAFLFLGLLGKDHAHAQAQEFVQRTHPVGVPLGQIVVHRDHMHAAAGEGVQVGGQGGGQGFTFPGAHLGDAALMQGDAPHQLDIEMAHAHHPGGGFAAYREGFREQLVESLAFGVGGLQFGGLGLQRGVVQLRDLIGAGVDRRHHTADPLELAVVLGPEDCLDDGSQHETSVLISMGRAKRSHSKHNRPGR